MFAVAACITQEHDVKLVVVAGLVCILSAFAAFAMLNRAKSTKGKRRRIWAAVGAIVTGNGIWSTHYIAMLAYDVGVPTSFALRETLLSAAIIQIFSIGAFAIIMMSRQLKAHCFAGALLGAGIACMHYVGMQGLRVSTIAIWDIGYVIASIAISISLSTIALYAFRVFEKGIQRYISPVVLVLAVCGLHFTAMTALTIVPLAERGHVASIPHTLLGALIGCLAIVILLVITGAAIFDRYLVDRERYARSLEALIERLQESEKKAQEANNTKSEFVANISHEIRTPLNGVLGMMRLLQDSPLNTEQKNR